MFLGPAALAEMAVDGGGLAGGLPHRRPWTHVPAFPVILVGHDVVVLHRVEDFRPVQSGEVAEVWVLLDPHGSSGDVHQAMEADLSQLEHLEYHQSVVEEEVAASDDSQVGEKLVEALQPINSKEQKVIGDHDQFREAEASEILRLGPEHEQDLQVAFDNGAVLKGLKVGCIVPDVLAWTNWKESKCRRVKKITLIAQTLFEHKHSSQRFSVLDRRDSVSDVAGRGPFCKNTDAVVRCGLTEG